MRTFQHASDLPRRRLAQLTVAAAIGVHLVACAPPTPAGEQPGGSRLQPVGGGAAAGDPARQVGGSDGARIDGLPRVGGPAAVDLPGDGPGAALGRKSPHEANEMLLREPELLQVLGPVLTALPGEVRPGIALEVVPPALLALPPAVDLRPEMPPVRNQFERPLCEIFAVCAALDHLAAKGAGLAARTHAPQFLWWNYQRLVASQVEPGEVWGSTGTDGPHLALLLRAQAFRGVRVAMPGAQGVVAEELAPFAPTQPFDSAATPLEAITRAHLGPLADRLAAGEVLPADGAAARFLTLDAPTLKLALAEGHPVVVGVPCLPAAWRDLAPGRDLVPELDHGAADETGGHAVLLVGYQDDPALPGGGAFRFRNSWGEAWGDAGYGRLSYQLVADYGDDPYFLEALAAPFQARYELRYPGL